MARSALAPWVLLVASGCYDGVAPERMRGSGAGTESASEDAGGPGGGASTQDGGPADGEDDGATTGSGSDEGGDDGPAAECDGAPVAVGAAPLRRLTRSAYQHTVRDLLGLDADAEEALAPDERVGAFFANAVAPVSDLAVEQYMDLAERLAEQAASDLAGLVPCNPASGGRPCAAAFVDDFVARAYRRPLSAEERSRYLGVYDVGADSGGFTQGIRLVIRAALQSPYFLYLAEFGTDGSGATVVLTGHELASRMSYFLWNTMPDEELFQAALDGALDDPDGLEAQARRMLDDPRAQDAIASFHLQWTRAGEVADIEKDPAKFPEFTPALRDAMKTEVTRFANWVFTEGEGTLEELLTAPVAFPEGLFGLYAMAQPAGFDPEAPLPVDASRRAGLLTQPALLSVLAHANQSSPVSRGVMVRERFLCQALPPPPPEVDNVPPSPDPNATTRERFDQHRADPSCAGCHQLIDGIGFGFEHYDALGRFRATEGGIPIDASGELVSAGSATGTFDGAPELARRLASSDTVQRCVAEQWFRFGLGRALAEADACSMDSIMTRFEASEFNLRELLVALVTSDAFRHVRVEGTGITPGREVQL